MATVRWTSLSVYASQNPERPVNHEQESGESEKPRVDWIVVPLFVSMFAGFVVSVIDFLLIQRMVVQVHWLVTGLLLLVIGTAVKFSARKRIVEAGLGSALNSAYLQIVKDQQLVTDGLYKYNRHPIYAGDILQKYGWVIIYSSLYGLAFVTVGFACYLYRIRKEEEMLIKAFGEEYRNYQRTTKKLIPYVY